MAESHELSASECESLLRSHDVGRVAVSTPTGPHIVPVNYIVTEDAIIIRTSPYSVLGTYGRNTTLALEIDGFDHERERGWSVQARGRCGVIEDYAEIAKIREGPQSPPWAGGSRSQYMCLRWSELIGRRLGSGWSPLDDAAANGKAQGNG
jgi:nitroimidazol reductase NimA-like FMN-containing flavoprotein (pyridoxamine 5'-phosphate oxidase superfamily)